MTTATEPDSADFEALLEFLRSSRGFDFTGYKRGSLGRRFAKRLEAVGADDYADYLDFLQVHPEEYAELFDTILINVTSFFRDPPAWRYLDEHVIAELAANRPPDADIRVWSAGCASGEEAYSVAMLLVRALGEERFRTHVKIYATDVDDDALDTARQAVFSGKGLEPVPDDLRERCFEPSNGGMAFRPELRRSLIFGRTDLVQDAPISRIDLLVCRNVLMYFTAETQTRILGHLHFALRDDGRLFLGKSEMLLTHGSLFSPVDLKCRVFAKVPRPTLREGLSRVMPAAEPGLPTPDELAPVRDGAFDAAPTAQLAVDRGGNLALANQRARAVLGLSAEDVGRPLQDLEISYRPVELRSAIERAYAERGPVGLGEVAWGTRRGEPRRYDIGVAPVFAHDGALIGASVTFADVTEHAATRDELERSKRELEVAYEELQSTVEELETTNEELQSTNEELETTNEELQSTNEELETMNEELHSTNEELETINHELRLRTRELDQVNAFLEGILTSLHVGVAMIDTQHVVQVWNDRAHDLWGLRQEEVQGQHFMSLDIGLPVDGLRGALRETLDGSQPDPLVIDATNRRGRPVRVRVTSVPLRVDGAHGAVLVMEELGEQAPA